jgi:Pyruvate/2-oxoacid:ferredoxin oxidoreductase gamma subunit
VVVCNNFNFGMTGGQHSPTTPCDAKTTTTPLGAKDHPFDICATVAANGAALAARWDAFEAGLGERLEEFLRTPGFALVDIWELCTAYFVPANRLNRGSLAELSARLNLPFGTIHRQFQSRTSAPLPPEKKRDKQGLKAEICFPWKKRVEMTVAGSAGQRIRSALGVIGELAVAAGLHAAQQDDFPITVRKGFSISSLIISPDPILYTGIDHPDLVVLLSKDGADRVGELADLRPQALVVADADLSIASTPARVLRIKRSAFEKGLAKETMAMSVLAFALVAARLIDGQMLLSAAQTGLSGSYRDENLRAIQLGVSLVEAELSAPQGQEVTYDSRVCY